MNKSQQETIVILKAAKSVFQRILSLPTYQPTLEEWVTLYRFREVWEAGLNLDAGILEKAGIGFDEIGFFIGYCGYNESLMVQNVSKARTQLFQNKERPEQGLPF